MHPRAKVLTMRRQAGAIPDEAALVHHVRSVNPSSQRSTETAQRGLKLMVGLGSQILDRLHQAISETEDEDGLLEQIRVEWKDLAIAWNSTAADRVVALTRLQEALRRWTATTAVVAGDGMAQRYRRRLHLLLDH